MDYEGRTGYQVSNARPVKDVASSNQVIWSICEDDIRAMAHDRGVRLTDDQMDTIAGYVERGLSAVCNWFMVVDMAFDEVVGSKAAHTS